jgi:hypothetical protein
VNCVAPYLEAKRRERSRPSRDPPCGEAETLRQKILPLLVLPRSASRPLPRTGERGLRVERFFLLYYLVQLLTDLFEFGGCPPALAP